MPQKDKAVISRKESMQQNEKRKGINYLFVIAIDDYEHCPTLYNCLNDRLAFLSSHWNDAWYWISHLMRLYYCTTSIDPTPWRISQVVFVSLDENLGVLRQY